jgi:hypothetical protein
MVRSALLFVAVVLSACGGGDFECSEAVPCTGFGETCVDGTCVLRACSSNVDCPMENVCAGRSCEPGCYTDRDCYPGDACNVAEGVCEPRGCITTHVDCGFKQFCNSLTGECYDAGGVYCRPCSQRSVVQDCNGGNPSGTNQCWNNFCTVDCSAGRECPSGFDCYPFGDNSGNIITWQCLTYCWLYDDVPTGGSAVAPPGDVGILPLDPSCPPDELLPAPGGE